MPKVVVSLSGGLDSTTLLYKVVSDFGAENVYAISFDYKQRHFVELECAKRTCQKLKVAHKIVDASFLYDIVKPVSSMVTNDLETPIDASERMPSTYVPFRNAIFSAIIASYAESVKANMIALGLCREELEGNEQQVRYWDTTPEFVSAFQALMDLNDAHSIKYIAPFASLTKKEEIELGITLKVPYEDTWTCYAGKVDKIEVAGYDTEPMGGRIIKYKKHYQPCEVCPSCIGRAKAFNELGLEDPSVVKGFWSQA